MQHAADTDPLQSPADIIFLDIVQNLARPKNRRRRRRADHLLTSPSKMTQVQETILRGVEQRLRAIFGRSVGVRDLEMLVPEVVRRFGEDPDDDDARRRGYLGWLQRNWPQAIDMLQQMYTDTPRELADQTRSNKSPSPAFSLKGFQFCLLWNPRWHLQKILLEAQIQQITQY
jgi:hypothetical protein